MNLGHEGRFDALTKKLCVSCFTTQAWLEFDLDRVSGRLCAAVQTLHQQIRSAPRIPIQFTPVEEEWSTFSYMDYWTTWIILRRLWSYLWIRFTADMKIHTTEQSSLNFMKQSVSYNQI